MTKLFLHRARKSRRAFLEASAGAALTLAWLARRIRTANGARLLANRRLAIG